MFLHGCTIFVKYKYIIQVLCIIVWLETLGQPLEFKLQLGLWV